MLLSSEPGERVDALHRLRQLEDGSLQRGGDLNGSSSAAPESQRRGLRVSGSMRNGKNSLYPQLSCPPDFATEEHVHSPQRPLLENNTKRRLTQNKSDLTTTQRPQSLPTPITRTPTVCGISYECGRRPHMEDVVSCVSNFWRSSQACELDFFGVFDGHGSDAVAKLCGEELHGFIAEELTAQENRMEELDIEAALKAAFRRTDHEAGRRLAGVAQAAGSTAVTALVNGKYLAVANVGDSRAILCRNGMPMQLTEDHKPNRPDERARVEAAGGHVIFLNGFRVLGVLAMSRAIGDHYLRPYVIAEPEVLVTPRCEEDEFLVMASDGIWDVLTNDEVCKAVKRSMERYAEYTNGTMGEVDRTMCSTAEQLAADVLVKLALAKGSGDNLSCVVVNLASR